MRRARGILVAPLLLLFGSVLLPGLDVAQAQALCTDGQEMKGPRPCTCRPPLKFLPGNICGSGRKVQTPQPGTPTTVGVRAICEVNMVPEATGCRCVAPMKVLPGGRCGLPTAAG